MGPVGAEARRKYSRRGCGGFDVKKSDSEACVSCGFLSGFFSFSFFFFEQSHDLWELKSSFISSLLLSIIADGEQLHAAATF